MLFKNSKKILLLKKFLYISTKNPRTKLYKKNHQIVTFSTIGSNGFNYNASTRNIFNRITSFNQ